MAKGQQTELTARAGYTEKASPRLKRASVDLFRRSTRYILEKSSRLARDVFHHGPGSWQALRTIYENRPEGLSERLLHPVTLGLAGCRDTRNRLDIYTDLICGVFEDGNHRYLDLASGCSLAPIRAAKCLAGRPESTGYVIRCSDISKSAIEYSRKAAEREGVSGMMSFGVYSIGRVHEFEQPESFDAVGTHGYLDYKTVEEAVRLLRNVRKIMRPGAVIITTNMKVKEGFDLTRFMMQFYGGWFIKYKTSEEMGNMLHDAGFDDIRVRETPLGHHYIATGIKRV